MLVDIIEIFLFQLYFNNNFNVIFEIDYEIVNIGDIFLGEFNVGFYIFEDLIIGDLKDRFYN